MAEEEKDKNEDLEQTSMFGGDAPAAGAVPVSTPSVAGANVPPAPGKPGKTPVTKPPLPPKAGVDPTAPLAGGKRVFIVDDRTFDDPDPEMTITQVRESMSTFFPELVNADVKSSLKGADLIVELKRRVGTKG